MRIKSLSHAAISISLVFVSFMFFRGAANIVNTIIIPIIFYLNYAKFSLKEYILLIAGVFVFSILFFFQQLFFIILYALLGFILYHSFKREINIFLRIIIFAVVFLVGFRFTITITDIVIGTALRKVLSSVVGGNQLFLILLYLTISLLVSLFLNFTGFQMNKLIKKDVL